MAKKAEKEVAEIAGIPEDLFKEWKDKMVLGTDFKDSDLKTFSTNSIKLDWALTLPFIEGSIIEIYGEQSTGKTTLALEVASNMIKDGRKVFYLDLERKLRQAQIDMIRDFDKNGLTILYPHTGEEALNMMEGCVRNFKGCGLILDAVAGLLPEVEDAEGAEKQTMGTVAKLCAKITRKLSGLISQNKCLLIALNHKTATMSMYGPSDTVHGGKAITNRAAQRIELTRHMSKLIKSGAGKDGEDGGEIIGQVVKCKVTKNNVGRPFREVEVPIIYGQGIARELDLFEFAEDLGIFQKGGAWYEFDGQKFRKNEILGKLLKEPDFCKLIKEKVMAALS